LPLECGGVIDAKVWNVANQGYQLQKFIIFYPVAKC